MAQVVALGLPSVAYLSYVVCELLHRGGRVEVFILFYPYFLLDLEIKYGDLFFKHITAEYLFHEIIHHLDINNQEFSMAFAHC